MDRRIGENDPTMTPEEKALERFVREKKSRDKRASVFDLEDNGESSNLTHAGKSLSFDTPWQVDEFDEPDLEENGNDAPGDFLQERPTKRRKLSDASSSEQDLTDGTDQIHPEQRKTKKEVMEEVIAKSKLHKYERQQAKEDDDDLRAELDKGLPDLYALLRGTSAASRGTQASSPPIAGMNADRLALLNGKDRSQADKEYDERLRQMAMDQRAKPTARTLTDEEKLHQKAKRLEDLESERLRRMKGEPEKDNSEVGEISKETDIGDIMTSDDNNVFGLGLGLQGQIYKPPLDVEDEDEFIIEEDLEASISDMDISDPELREQLNNINDDDGDDEEFVQGLLSDEENYRGLKNPKIADDTLKPDGTTNNLAFTYECPQTHEELLNITKDTILGDLPIVVQRIRALYHPRLASENKIKLGRFATALVDHVSYLANQAEHPPFAVLEALIRHVHSLAKMFPEEIGRAFRSHLKEIHVERPTSPNPGDLMIFTAIGVIFSTSDQFHQVVTPAMLCMSRYLSQKVPGSLKDIAIGTYQVTLCLKYQQFSKRYIPEAVNYILNVLWGLAPVKPKQLTGAFPYHVFPDTLRLQNASQISLEDERLTFWDLLQAEDGDKSVKIALIHKNLALIENMVVIWSELSAFCEIFEPLHAALQFLASKTSLSHIDNKTRDMIRETFSKIHDQLIKSKTARKPLRLHNHRPLAIKTYVPKFEESYNPDKHYDPDRDRSEVAQLKAEHKRERKGALRELRKDANFIARENLREKKEKDSAYEKKYKRLVAEIQGDEGREAKSYEREKRMRKKSKR